MSTLALGEFDVSGVGDKQVSFSHVAIPVIDIERSIAFYEKYLQMKVIKRRENPTNVWMADGIRPFQLALLQAEPHDLVNTGQAGSGNGQESKLAHPIIASTHLGFTCSSCSEVRRIAEMAKEEGILAHGPNEEGWPGGYCADITDPSGHCVEISYNQEAGYNAVFNPVCNLDELQNSYRDGQQLWDD